MSRRGAALNVGRVQTPTLFQSARSTRNATRLEKLMSTGFVLSIPAPRAERDMLVNTAWFGDHKFQPPRPVRSATVVVHAV